MREFVRVEVDPVSMQRLQLYLGHAPKEIPRAVAAAINRTGRWQRTQISRRIRQEVNLTQKDLAAYLSYEPATARSLHGTIRVARRRRIPLIDFGARQTRRGVTYKIARKGGRQLAAGAFINAGPKAGMQVWRRLGKERYPIARLQGVSAWGVFVKNPKVHAVTRQEVADRLRVEVEQRVRFALLKESGAL